MNEAQVCVLWGLGPCVTLAAWLKMIIGFGILAVVSALVGLIDS